MIPRLESQHTGNQDVELLQQNVKKWAKVLEDNPLLDGVLIEDIAFDGVNDITFNHKLGRMPRGWFPVDIETGAGMSVDFGRSAWTDKTLTLWGSANCTAAFWVF